MREWVRDTSANLENECWDREYVSPGVIWGATWEWKGQHHWGLYVENKDPTENATQIKGFSGIAPTPEAARAACDDAFRRFAEAVADAARDMSAKAT